VSDIIRARHPRNSPETADQEENGMRRATFLMAGLSLLLTLPLFAQSADEIVLKYVRTIGGMEKIDPVKTLRRTGKYTGGGGFQAAVVNENKRPDKVREDFSIQGMTGVTAYDGRTGWKIEPWDGKKDAEALGEEEMKSILEDSDFDGPLVNYRQKGNKVEYAGMEPVEGTDAYKLKVTVPNGDVFNYFMDTDYYVPIRIESKRMVRGELREYETSLGDYKEVNGWYLPFSSETGVKGSNRTSKITWDRIEANVAVPDSRFERPSTPGAAASVQPKKPSMRNEE
jgi:hypothetical protein